MNSFTTRLSVLALLLCFCWAGESVAQQTTVSIPAVSADAEETVQVPVNVDDFNDVGAITLVINFDTEVLSFTGLDETARDGFNADVPSEGELRITWFDASASNPINIEDGTLLTINFGYGGGSGALVFDEENSEIADSEANPISVTYKDGVVASDLGSIEIGIADEAVPGETVSIPLIAELDNVGALSLGIEFDPSVLQFEELTNDQSGLSLSAGVPSSGLLNVGGFNTGGSDLDGEIARLNFTFLGGSTVLDVESSEITDPSENELFAEFTAGSVAGFSPVVSLPTMTVLTGETVVVPLEASNLTNTGAMSLRIQFNNAVLEFVGSSDAVSNFNLQVNRPNPGELKIAGFNASGVDLDGTVVNLEFEASETGSSPLDFDPANSEVTGVNGAVYNTTYQSGSVESVPFILGDVNQNGTVDAGDATLVLRYTVDAVTLSSTQQSAAEVSGDGEILANDASFILQHVVGKIDEFPAEQSASLAKATRGDATLSMGKISSGQEGGYSVPLKVENLQGTVTSGQVSLTFGSDDVRVVEVESSLSPSSDWMSAHHFKQDTGVLKFSFAGTSSLEQEGEIATVTFTSSEETAPTVSGEGRINAGSLQQFGGTADAGVRKVTLQNNAPNPFRSQTRIEYSLPSEMNVKLEVFNILGQHVETLVNKKQGSGTYEVVFEPRNLSSGNYFYRFTAGDVVKTRRMTFVK